MMGISVAPAESVLLLVVHIEVPVAESKKQLWLFVVTDADARS
jgi:hypothetical protein